MLFVAFAIYLVITGRWASVVLDKIFDFNHHLPRKILGIFAGFISLGWIAGLAILFLPLTFWALVAIFFLNASLYFLLARWAKKIETPAVILSPLKGINSTKDPLNDNRRDYSALPQNDRRKARFAALVFLILVAYGFYLLYNSQTGNAVLTPWQVINPQYIFIFFLSTLTLGILIWSKLKTSTIILFLILQTFLLHSYLPLTHKLIYGADGWRHVANEQRLSEGKMFKPAALRGEDINDNKFQIPNTKFQNLKTKIGQLSYSNFWVSGVILAKVFKTDLLTITKWFLPILWSLIFPLLLFEIGRTFGWDKKQSLFLAWLGLLPFTWQATGSFTLPASLGFLIWLFLILLILKRANSPSRAQVWILAGAGVGLVSGYILYFILFWLAFIVAELLIFVSSRAKRGDPTDFDPIMGLLRRFWLLAMTVIIMLIFPAAELLADYSQFDRNINWLWQIKQAVGNFLGIYLANGPRPHDIAFGNIIFNQTPLAAFVPNLLTQWRWWIVVFMVCFFGIIMYGWMRVWKTKMVVNQWLAIVSVWILGGYIITNYFLTGSHILARRLDAVVALFLILLFFYGLEKLILKSYRKIILAICILTIGITTSHSLGPDTNTVSANEYEAAKYIWSAEQNETKKCVLGDTYQLLALEAVSAKEIIGGGFPIDANFGQPERVELFNKSQLSINDEFLKDVYNLTYVNHCWFVGKTENFQKQGIVGGDNSKIFGDVAVVRYNINQ